MFFPEPNRTNGETECDGRCDGEPQEQRDEPAEPHQQTRREVRKEEVVPTLRTLPNAVSGTGFPKNQHPILKPYEAWNYWVWNMEILTKIVMMLLYFQQLPKPILPFHPQWRFVNHTT